MPTTSRSAKGYNSRGSDSGSKSKTKKRKPPSKSYSKAGDRVSVRASGKLERRRSEKHAVRRTKPYSKHGPEGGEEKRAKAARVRLGGYQKFDADWQIGKARPRKVNKLTGSPGAMQKKPKGRVTKAKPRVRRSKK